MNRGAFGAFQQVGHIGGGHIIGGLAVDGRDDVPGANARAIGGSSGEGSNDDNLIVARSDGHAHAVVLAALVLAQQRVGLGIEEIRVWIEHVQHARNGPVVDSFVRVHWFGIVLLDDVVNLGELLKAVADIGVAVVGGYRILLGKKDSEESAKRQKCNDEYGCTLRTTGHL